MSMTSHNIELPRRTQYDSLDILGFVLSHGVHRDDT